ncbi:MAG: transposase zinc-binding domain-containing protein [Candidatus Latescibacteria bacterium]|nr:transposase zinc-binding domain-containing protein [Candidatus Latescibacterota bacterium]
MYICDKTNTKPVYIPVYKPVYKPGLERRSLYKGLWIKYWKEFQNIYDETFKEKYGELTQRHKLEVRKLISCGKFQNGFNRYYCPDCGTMLVVPLVDACFDILSASTLRSS